jgi:hypothetical protein
LQAVTGVFLTRSDAERAVEALRAMGIAADKITLLTPGDVQKELQSVPVDTAEQPGIGKAIGAVVGAASGFSGGSLLLAAVVPGVGLVTAAGLLGAGILGLAGAAVGAAAGKSLENFTAQGLPEDEIFVYEDVLRRGGSVVIALAEDSDSAARIRELLQSKGAQAIDAARHQWWIGLRSAESEHYTAAGRNFGEDERFYRLGFEAALHARNRCKEFDQTSAEMARNVEDLERQYPGRKVGEAYTRGYQRGREYYQRLCDESKAA